eukprot:scaffold9037_cov55-Alexandrium_tamarense.AAC.1
MVTPCDVPVGVITGDNVTKLLQHAKDNSYAIPAFNCTRCVLFVWLAAVRRVLPGDGPNA